MNLKSLLILVVSLCYGGISGSEVTSSVGSSSVEKKPLTESTTATTENVTTTSAPPVTPSPAPAVVDNKGDWKVQYNNASSAICIRLVAEIQLKVGYKGTNKTGEMPVVIPKRAEASGNCTTGTLVLRWRPSGVNTTKKNDSITFDFSLNNKTHTWKLASVSGMVQLMVSNSSKMNETVLISFKNSTSIFNTHVGMSYLCSKSNSYNVSLEKSSYNDINITWASLDFSQLRVEAFKPESKDNSVFGIPNNCELTPDIVPIAVGCALAGLVVLVLVAYLIAQRRPSARGYRSV